MTFTMYHAEPFPRKRVIIKIIGSGTRLHYNIIIMHAQANYIETVHFKEEAYNAHACLPLYACVCLMLVYIYSYLQLTDQPLELFVQGKYNKVPTMMVIEIDVYPSMTFTNKINGNNLLLVNLY